MPRSLTVAIGAFLLHSISAQSTTSSCPASLTGTVATPLVASGYEARLVANKLKAPRGIIFDSAGHLLVVQSGHGVTSLEFKDNGGACLSVSNTQDVVVDSSLNHGIEVSSDGKTLYASSSGSVYSWDYDAKTQKNTSVPQTLVTGMVNSDHTTRTLLLSKKVEGKLLVSRGSTSNLDYLALDITSGHSQIKSFDVGSRGSDQAPYQFDSEGTLLGWGLRNSVGVAEHPVSGGIFSVENSVDQMIRDGVDIHENNPGEEMNFHGYLNGTRFAGQGQNYGYPNCYAAWNVSEIPGNSGLKVGTQFAIGDQNTTLNDTTCSRDIAPVLTFPAHWAPLDLKFNANGSTAWITSHGSWNRAEPDGYLLYAVAFTASSGMPVEPADSTSAVIPIMSNPDNSKCPDGCFRPVGLAFDTKGRLFMSSDSTGEIYVITKTDGNGVENVTPTAAAPSATSSKAAAGSLMAPTTGVFGALYAGVAAAMWFF